MLEKLTKLSTESLINKHIVDADDRDVYEYGFHIFYSNVLLALFVGIISVILKQLPQTVVFYFVFILLRNTAGGYHANTQHRCFFISAIIWLLSLCIINQLTSGIIIIAMSAMSTFLIWIKAPIEHENNPLGDYGRTKMKKHSRAISVAFLLTCVVLFILMVEPYKWIAAAIAVGMFSHFILFAVAILNPTARKKEN